MRDEKVKVPLNCFFLFPSGIIFIPLLIFPTVAVEKRNLCMNNVRTNKFRRDSGYNYHVCTNNVTKREPIEILIIINRDTITKHLNTTDNYIVHLIGQLFVANEGFDNV